MGNVAARPGEQGEQAELGKPEMPGESGAEAFRTWARGCREALVWLRHVRRLQDSAFGRVGPARVNRDALGGGTLGLAGSQWSELTERLDRLLTSGARATRVPTTGPGEQPTQRNQSRSTREFGPRGRELSYRITELAGRKFVTNISTGMREEFREAMRDLISADQLTAMVNEFSAADVDACGQLRDQLGEAVRSLRDVRTTLPGRQARPAIEILNCLRFVIECQQQVIVGSRLAMLTLLEQVRTALEGLAEDRAVGPWRFDPAIAGTVTVTASRFAGPGAALAGRVGLLDGPDPAPKPKVPASQPIPSDRGRAVVAGSAADPGDYPDAAPDACPGAFPGAFLGADAGSYLGGDTVYAIWKSMDDALLRLEEETVGECLRLDDVLRRLGAHLDMLEPRRHTPARPAGWDENAPEPAESAEPGSVSYIPAALDKSPESESGSG